MAAFTSVASPYISSNSSSSLPPSIPNTFFLPRNTFRNPEFRVWKHRRLKKKPKRLALRNEFEPSTPSSPSPFDFLSFLSSDWIPPAVLGFGSALALSLANRRVNLNEKIRVSDSDSRVVDIGEWILFTSPTPFNRFVLLRCPSISFEDGEFLEDVNAKLVKEEKHYVRLDSGRIQVSCDNGGGGDGDKSENEKLEYQRECVRTEDGGVISLDWPANLDLSEEHGLDTAVLLIPGTTEGSKDDNVRAFVCECLRRGLFPVVMNPRGCAGSPLTTARLFTAADSDDICSAIQFITKARPWSTLMSVGWGYGANMLTKYLAEAGEKTPLSAATCIDNPFDLDEATRTTPYSAGLDKKLTGGLIDILKANKGLFQGRSKGFDVEKAISAESVRDFEKAISMVSYGFDSIEEFYSNSSTRSVVGKLKIPVLFVQNDDGAAPLFSIPRAVIAENPFTSLFLCSCVPSNVTAISWYQQITIEWLTAVELGLLKGRHPLLQDIDVTINPSRGLALVEGRTSDTNGRLNGTMNLAELNGSNHYVDSMKELLQEGGSAARSMLTPHQISRRKLDPSDQIFREIYGVFPHTASADSASTENVEDDPEGNDRGQVLQTAQVVMNMLDVTMPGTLKEEEKKKVLAAVGQGETLIKALQDAVPEDICGRLTNSVSEILQAQGKNLNFDALLSVNRMAGVSSGLRSNIKQNASENSDIKIDDNDYFTDQKVTGNGLWDGKGSSQADMDNHTGEGTGAQQEEKSAKTSDVLESKSVNNHGDDYGLTNVPTESQNSNDRFDSESSSNKVGQYFEIGEEASETASKTGSSSQKSGITDSGESGMTQFSKFQDDEMNQLDVKDSNISARLGDHQDSSNEPSETGLPAGTRPADTCEAPASSIPESQVSDHQDSSNDSGKAGSPAGTKPADACEVPASPIPDSRVSDKGGDDSKSKDERPVQADQNRTSEIRTPTFSVSQALDALSGLDDSTQVAVNSVFGVIEDMITQLEERKNDSTAKKGNESNDAENQSTIEKTSSGGGLRLENRTDGENQEDTSPEDMDSANGNNSDGNMENYSTAATGWKNDNKKENPVVNKLATRNADKPSKTNELFFYKTINPYVEAFYNEWLRKYIISEVQKMKSSHLGTNNALFLYYNPKEGHWLLLEQPGGDNCVLSCNSIDRIEHSISTVKEDSMDTVIEPSYVILDSERHENSVEALQLKEKLDHDNDLVESKVSVKTVVLDSLKNEVSRRFSATDWKDMETGLVADMEEVANAVYLAAQEHNQNFQDSDFDCDVQEYCKFRGKHIIEAISQAVHYTSHLKRLLPVGVIVGSSLAALRKFINEASVHEDQDAASLNVDQDNVIGFKPKSQLLQEATHHATDKINLDPLPEHMSEMEEGTTRSSSLDVDVDKKAVSKTLNKDTLMVGAVTAALGASALLRSQQEDLLGSDNSGTTSSSLKMKETKTEAVNLEDLMDDKHHSNIVTSLAEKAMSVAAPVVPTKEDGGVDQERLVAMLAELGQKGGVLKLVGKLALLWGGLRGAISLTDRLISFLRIAERPLLLRVLGFFGMVLVLWSPVLVPLLPTLFHNWATHNSSRIAELACILGLYTAVTILIMQWGKRIRGYEYPLKQYGLDLMSLTKTQEFLSGLVGGVVLVLCIQSVNALLGVINFSLPTNLRSSSLDLPAKIKVYAQLFLLTGQGIVTAAAIAFVEELLFRSWLLEEIAADLGYHPGILLSGLAFSLSQRSVLAIPGLWLLSLCLTGARLRRQGSLFIPIGVRTGIMASSYILHTSGFLIYQPKFHCWIAGMHPLQPFGGLVGLLFALLLAVALYPRQPCLREKYKRMIRA